MIWVLKGPGPEQAARMAEAHRLGIPSTPPGLNTAEEARQIATLETEDVCWVVTSAYHVPRAYLTLAKAFKAAQNPAALHVWGTGTVTGQQAREEAAKLLAAQAQGDALAWSDL